MKHLQSNPELKLTEILFEHRNKEYGAYVLRTESDRILTKAFFVGIGLLAAVSITPIIISSFRTAEVPSSEDGGYVLPPPIDIVDPVNPPVEAVQPTIKVPIKNIKEFDSTVPTPTQNADESTIVKNIPKDAVAGLKNNLNANPVDTNVHIPITTAPGISTTLPPRVDAQPTTIVDNNTINTVVDVEAAFVGGEKAFRQKVMNNFDGSGFDSNGLLKATITFVVEKDGSISNIKADGKDLDFNSEAIRTVKSIKGKWTPAKIKGEPVRSYFRLPISMEFQ